MAKCLLCFSEHIGEIDSETHEWGCWDCCAFGPTEDDISNPCVDYELANRLKGQVDRHLTDDPEDAHHGRV